MVKKISAIGNLSTTELNDNLHLSTGTCKAIVVVKVLKEIANILVLLCIVMQAEDSQIT